MKYNFTEHKNCQYWGIYKRCNKRPAGCGPDPETLSQRWSAPVFPLKAADFMKRGVAKGPALGAAMRAAEAAWIAAGFPEDADAIDAIAAQVLLA